MSTVSNTDHRNRPVFLYLFLLFLIIDLVVVYIGKNDWRFISKPALMPMLVGYLISNVSFANSNTKWVMGALPFSWLGDVLLMFEERNSIFFLIGLSAFLIAHIFYILFFHKIRVAENIRGRWPLVLLIAVYYVILISILYPRLNDMRIPVAIYGIVICFMLLLALHMPFMLARRAGLCLMAGAILFVISDSILAINKFYQSFEWAGIVIMLTYGLSQLFIVHGAILYAYSSSTSKKQNTIAVS